MTYHADLVGIIARIFPPVTVYKKRVFWLQEVDPANKYPSVWALELLHDDVETLDDYKEGDAVSCSVIMKGKMLTRRGTNEQYVINNLQCIDIKRLTPADVIGKDQVIKLTVLADIPHYSIPKGREILFKWAHKEVPRYKAIGVQDTFCISFGPYMELHKIALDIIGGKASEETKALYTAEIVE